MFQNELTHVETSKTLEHHPNVLELKYILYEVIKIGNLETDLYKPIKKHFECLGYKVNAEVIHCDVTAIKDGRLVIIELKTTFNMTVLYQAIDRQKITNEVYIAIPKQTKRGARNKTKMLHVAKCLNIGIITVALKKSPKLVEVLYEPVTNDKPKNNIRSRKILKEISGRTVDNNLGGSTRKKITTAYTEKSLKVASALKLSGMASASELIKNQNCCADTWNILYYNHYGWFKKDTRGKYSLSEKGNAALSDKKYKELLSAILKQG